MVNSATQRWIDRLKNKPTTPTKNTISTAPIPTIQSPTLNTFTPKQQQMIADKFWTQQNFMDKVVEVWQTQWVDWNKLLNQTNAALKWTSIPNILWAESVNANKMLENDRTGFVAPDDALTNMINTTFPNLWTQLNKWYETTFGVWQEIEWMLKDELARYQSAYWPNWTMRKMLDEEIASQQQRLAWEKELMNVQYWLTNAGIDTNAMESWASSWQVAASKAAANKQSLLQQAEYNDRLAKFGTDKLNQYQAMEDKLSTYMQDYITKYWNSKDKYVIDNFNNLVNLQSNLAIQIKNLEAQNKALAADAANTAAIANAMWGKATSANVPTWPNAIDKLPAWYYDWLTPWWGQVAAWTITDTNNVWIPYAPQSLQSDWTYNPNMAWMNSWLQTWQTDAPSAQYMAELNNNTQKLKQDIWFLQLWINTTNNRITQLNNELQQLARQIGWNYTANPRYQAVAQSIAQEQSNLAWMKQRMAWLATQAKALWVPIQ